MNEYIIYNAVDGAGRIALRVERTGACEIHGLSSHGEVIQGQGGQLAVEETAALFEGFAAAWPHATAEVSGPAASIGRGVGDSAPEMARVPAHGGPAEVQAYLRAMHETASRLKGQTMSMGVAVESPKVDRQGEIDLTGVAVLGLGLFVLHNLMSILVFKLVLPPLLAWLMTLVADGGGSQLTGVILVLAITVVVGLLPIGALYLAAGYLVGKQARQDPERTATWAAAASVLLSMVVSYMLYEATTSLIALALFPFLARIGAGQGLKRR